MREKDNPRVPFSELVSKCKDDNQVCIEGLPLIEKGAEPVDSSHAAVVQPKLLLPCHPVDQKLCAF